MHTLYKYMKISGQQIRIWNSPRLNQRPWILHGCGKKLKSWSLLKPLLYPLVEAAKIAVFSKTILRKKRKSLILGKGSFISWKETKGQKASKSWKCSTTISSFEESGNWKLFKAAKWDFNFLDIDDIHVGALCLLANIGTITWWLM